MVTIVVPHPSEKEYVIQETGHGGATPLHTLAFGEPSPEIDEGWYALLQRIVTPLALASISKC